MITEINNVDKGLVPEPTAAVWDEPAEATYKREASSLIKGPIADKMFAAAHAAAAALRKLRRDKGTVQTWTVDAPGKNLPPDKRNPPRMGYCSECRGYVSTEERHLQCENGRPTELVTEEPEQITAYHERLYEATQLAKGRRTPPRPTKKIIPEWRRVPGFPNYVLHSVSRELWRHAYEITLSNGTTRQYPVKMVKPVNGSYSLSSDGVKVTRGINVLWTLTFPEYVGGQKRGATLNHDDYGRNRPAGWDGIHEWITDGGVVVRTRPQ